MPSPSSNSVDALRDSKLPLLVIEALGSLACGYYGNFVFFRFRNTYGFGNFENLLVAALMGLVVALAAWQGGKFAQRHGCFRTIACGLVGMIVALTCGVFFTPLFAQLVVMVIWTASQFVTWPALEAMVTEGNQGAGRARIVGVYSVVWAACSAVSYFFGGSLFDRLGSQSIFWLPPVLHLVQLLVLWRLARSWRPTEVTGMDQPMPTLPAGQAAPCPRQFQRMAWVANPFACVAAFTLLAMIPDLSVRMGLSVTQAGWFGSIWFFARMAAFVVLWQWTAWHYRFRWLLAGYLLLMAGFMTTLTARNLPWLSLGQVAFGLAVGLLYYSSLFYSMDVGEARAEQGGIHEAMMGAGNLVGPGVGALSLMVAPTLPNVGVWAVSALLAGGLGILITTRLHGNRCETKEEPRP